MNYLFIYPKFISINGFNVLFKPIIDHLNYHGYKTYVYFMNNKKPDYPIENVKIIESKNELDEILKKIDFVYIRSCKDFLHIYSKKIIKRSNKFKIIYDFRGFACYENYFNNKNPFKFLMLMFLEFLSYRRSDYVNTVSNVFKNELKKHFGFKKNISVIPCCVSNVFLKDKRDYDEIRFVYIGSTLKWQKYEETIDLYNEISKLIPNSKLSFFTKNKDVVTDYCEKVGVVNYSVNYLNNNDLQLELRNHDFAFLIRDDVMLNNVSSPIKFAEYLSCGLIPIISPNVGDYSQLVKDNNIGIVLDGEITAEYIFNLLSDKEIYNRIYSTANSLTWKENLKFFPAK